MAGDWIKMRVDLQTHPKIVRILSATKADKFRVIGGLHAVWSVFDAHSEDGVLNGYTPDALDHVISWDGFSAALLAVGWLVFDGAETLSLPEFGEHNGQSAKRRAEDQKRKRDGRKCPENVSGDCGQIADKKRTREEKRREDKAKANTHERQAARFDEFWSAYPMKKGRADAAKAWARRGLDAIADTIIADVVKRKASDRQWLAGYIPHGSTYVNGSGWEDSIESGRTATPEPGSAEYYLARAL